MRVKTAWCQKSGAAAALHIRRAMGVDHPALIVCLTSSRHDHADTARELARAFDSSTVVGVSTVGEMADGRALDGAVAAMALPDAIVGRVKAAIVDDLHDESAVDAVLAEMAAHFGQKLETLEPDRHLGLVLVDGLATGQDALLAALQKKTRLPWVGMGGADAPGFRPTPVSTGGRTVTQGAVLVLMRPRVPFRVVHVENLHTTDLELTATRVRDDGYELLELDGAPARIAYAQALGLPADDITLSGAFLRHPLGVNGVARSIARLHGNRLQLLGPVVKGQKVRVLDTRDVLSATRVAMQHVQADLGRISGVLQFHGAMRAQLLEADGMTSSHAELFEDVPTLGGTGFGELVGVQRNHSEVLVVFGR